MIKVCITGLIIVVCLLLSALINLVIGGYIGGDMGFSDEWEKPKCETINNVLVSAMWVVLAVLIVCTIILVVMTQ